MLRLSWVLRLALVIGAGALLLTATVVAIAPRVWRIANAHSEVPVELPDFADLAQRSYVYDVSGREIALFEVENSQPIVLADVPEHVVDAFLAIEDNEFWVHHGVNVRSLFRATLSNFASEGPIQGASTITMQVVKNDYMAGFERDGRYKLLQITYAVAAREAEDQTGDPRALPQHGVLRAELVRDRRRSRDLLRQARAAADASSRRRSWPGSCRHLPSYNPIINPERSRARFLQVLDRLEADELITEQERIEVEESFVLPERVRRRGRAGNRPHLLHGGAARLPPESQRHPRTHLRRALHVAASRWAQHPHHARSRPAGRGRAGPQRAAEQHRRDRCGADLARHQDRRDPGDGRWQGLRSRTERGQPGAGAQPDRIEHQAVHPVCRAPGRRALPKT